jgi:glucan 1,3-beta-glucosidase
MFVIRLLLFLGLSAVLTEAAPMPQASTAASGSYWMANIQRQGTVAFGNSSGYQIFRNVKDFGAKGKICR